MSSLPGSTKTPLAMLALAALGVVYGDIGTSPLYTIKAVFDPALGIPFTPANILGGLSALFWSLMVVVSLKYVLLVMRADNEREGGIMALLALATAAVRGKPGLRAALMTLGVAGAALFYGDSVITPAVTVLGAVEGLEVATPALKPYVLPISAGIIMLLFAFQRHGTAAVGALFGPLMLAWFAMLAAAGAVHVADQPQVLAALDPRHALGFATRHGVASFVVLGAVFLAVTGAEALYADMGHFGKRPIRLAWFLCTLPALVLNYFGQGALLIARPDALANPFFMMYPGWAQMPVVVIATLAAAVASQAVISGAYSMTRQAVQLGLLPRSKVVQTSATERGQIYMPVVNWTLLAGVLVAAVGFGSSTTLTYAYGLAVAGTMLITTVLTFFVIRHAWGYPLGLCIAATGFFLLVDAAFVAASAVKLLEGGWFPLALGVVLLVVMTTWRRGRERVADRMQESGMPMASFIASLPAAGITRVPNTGVFLTARPDNVPTALLHNIKHNQVLHERVIILSLAFEDIPAVPREDYVWIEDLGQGVWRIEGHYGFKEVPDVPRLLADCAPQGLEFDLMRTSFFLNRESYARAPGSPFPAWRAHLFGWLSHLATRASDYYGIPSNRVIELGAKVEI